MIESFKHLETLAHDKDLAEVFLESDGTRIDLTTRSTEEIVGLGIAMVPEGRRLFPKLTAEENLLLGAYRTDARGDITRNWTVRTLTVSGTAGMGQVRVVSLARSRTSMLL